MSIDTPPSPADRPPAAPTTGAEFPPPNPGDRYGRFRNEVMAGGSVTERPAAAEPFGGGVNGAIGGLAIIGLLVWLAVANQWMFLFVVGILVSVFLHETGHFVTARLTGMKATQFFLGFGPRLWSFHRGETEYGVRLLPLGAFVRIIGMNNLDEVPIEDEGRTYRQKSFPRRLLVISAGSIMHMLLAIVLFFSVFATKGQLEAIPGADVTSVSAGTPAAAAGLLADDVVLSVDGVVLEGDVRIGDAVRSHQPGDSVEIVYLRDGVEHSADVTLGSNPNTDDPDLVGTAFLGVSTRGRAEWHDMSIGSAITHSVTDLFPTSWESTKGVVKVLNPVNIFQHLTGETDDITSKPTTLVGATDAAGSIGSEEGLAGILLMLAALNVFIGVFNMFPLLPLDGGHAAIAVYERFREIGRNGRRYFTDVSKLMPFTMGVVVVLLFLFMSGLYLDITKPL